MFPTHQGWMTVDRPLALAARAITFHFQPFFQVENSVKDNPLQHPLLIVESTERVLVPISEIQSIELLSLLQLLQAIKHDFPKWKGCSEGLSNLFRERRIDPRNKYNKFYSTARADIAALYPWKGRSLFSLAGYFPRPKHYGALTNLIFLY